MSLSPPQRRTLLFGALATLILGSALVLWSLEGGSRAEESVVEPEVPAAPQTQRVPASIASETPEEAAAREALGEAVTPEPKVELAALEVAGDPNVFPGVLVLLDERLQPLEVLPAPAAGVLDVPRASLERTRMLRAVRGSGVVFAPTFDRGVPGAPALVDLGRMRQVTCLVEGLPDRTEELDELDISDFKTRKEWEAQARAELEEYAEVGLLSEEDLENHLNTVMEGLIHLGYFKELETDLQPNEKEEVGPSWDSGFIASEQTRSCGTLGLVVTGTWRDEGQVERACGDFSDEAGNLEYSGSLPSFVERLSAFAGSVALASVHSDPDAVEGSEDPDGATTLEPAKLELAGPHDSQLWVSVAEAPEFQGVRDEVRVRVRPVVMDDTSAPRVEPVGIRVDQALPGLWAIELFDKHFGYGIEHYAIHEDGLRELVVNRGLKSSKLLFRGRAGSADGIVRQVYANRAGIDLPVPCGVEGKAPAGHTALDEVPRGLVHISVRRGEGWFQGRTLACDQEVMPNVEFDEPRELLNVASAWLGLPTQIRWVGVLDEERTPIELVEVSEIRVHWKLPLLLEGETRLILYDRQGRACEWFQVPGEQAGPLAYVGGAWLVGEAAEEVLAVL